MIQLYLSQIGSSQELNPVSLLPGQQLRLPANGLTRIALADLKQVQAEAKVITQRQGDDLVLRVPEEDVELVVEQYYQQDPPVQIVVGGQDSTYFQLVPQDGALSSYVANLSEGAESVQVLGQTEAGAAIGVFALQPWMLGGLGIGAVAAGGGGGTVTAAPAGAIDTTAPTPPSVTAVSDSNGNGAPEVRGTAEANSTVTVTAPNGDTFTTTANSSGHFSLELASSMSPLTGTYSVSSSDASGNASVHTTVNTTDLTAPVVPSITDVVDRNGNGAPEVSGTAEAGSTVTVIAPNGETFTTTANSSGNYSLELASGMSPLVGTYSVSSTDASNNTSLSSTANTTDLTAPVAPSITNVIDSNGNGAPEVSGTAEANSTVTITAPDGETFTTTANSSGNYSLELITGMSPLTGTYSVHSTDGSKNTSLPSTANTTDLTAPVAPSIADVIDSNGNAAPEISGTAEAGSTVTITAPGGETFTTTANSSGHYSLELSGLSPLATVGTYSASSVDAGGNTSLVATRSETDTTALPVTITDVIDSNGNAAPEVSGTAEAGSTVTITAPGGETFTTTANGSGHYSLELSGLSPLAKVGTYSASSVDAGGNTSLVATRSETDTTALPVTITDVIDSNGNAAPEVSGTAEAGSTVTITAPGGETFTTTANSSGHYSLELSGLSPLAKVGTYSASSVDAGGNTSLVATRSETDTTALPVTITDVIDSNGNAAPEVSGTAEAGSTVTITAPGGETFTTTANGSGHYSLELSGLSPLAKVGTYSASSVDAGGNTSLPGTRNESDVSAPAAPSIIVDDQNANSEPEVRGTVEAQSTVTITAPNGETYTTVAGVDGAYSLELSGVSGLTGTYSATSRDGSGNTSTPVAQNVTVLRDYIVSGDASANLINSDYVGDPQADRIDHGDAIDGSNDDVIQAGAGNDSIDGGLGADWIDAGDGNDTIFLMGVYGNDTIIGGEVGDTVGGDTLSSAGIATGTLNTSFTGDEAGTVADGSSVAAFSQIERFEFGSSNDDVDAHLTTTGRVFSTGAGVDNVMGGSGSDTIIGGSDADTLRGGEGNDVVFSEDQIYSVNLLTNGHFEATGVAVGGFVPGNPLGWSSADNVNLGTTARGVVAATWTDGAALYLDTLNVVGNGSGVQQTVSAYDASKAYTLSVDVGAQAGSSAPVTVEFWVGASLAAQATYVFDMTSFNAMSRASLNLWVTPGFSTTGEAMKVVVYNTADAIHFGQTFVDNVELRSVDVTVNDGVGGFLYGDAGHDALYGTDGDDLLDGGVGHDTLIGGRGADTLIGGAGSDFYDLRDDPLGSSNPAQDTIVLTNGFGRDRVVNFDFSSGAADRLDVSAYTVDGAPISASGITVVSDGNGGVVLKFSSGDEITIANTSLAEGVIITTGHLITAPVALDLNGDGQVGFGRAMFDVNGDGYQDETAWVAAQDGLLVWDRFGDGMVHDTSQYAFSQYGAPGATDLQGLAAAFDTDGDGQFTGFDALFDQFSVWQDLNQDGRSQAGEVRRLVDVGVKSIQLVGDGVVQQIESGGTDHGHAYADLAFGGQMLIVDVSLQADLLQKVDLHQPLI